MNIVFTGGFTYPIGMAGTKRVQHYIDYLIDKDIPVKVLIVNNSINNIQKFGKKGDYKHVTYRFYSGASSNLIIRLIWYPFVVISACTFLIRSKIKKDKNILFVYNGLNIEDFILLIFAKLIGYKIITDIVEDYTVQQENISARMKIKLKSNSYLEKRISLFTDGIVVISTYLEDKFRNIVKNKIPIYLVPVSAAHNDRQKNKADFDKVIIAYSGSFGYKDGLGYLIRAFNLVNKKHNNTILRLSGIGNDPKKYLDLADNSNVEYIGFLDENEYFDFITSSDILCMTRIGSVYASAGFPFKLGEYLATGNPVIATDVGDIKRYLINGTDALIVPPDDVTEIAEALNLLIENEKLAGMVGYHGKLKWNEYFNASLNSEKLYHWLLNL